MVTNVFVFALYFIKFQKVLATVNNAMGLDKNGSKIQKLCVLQAIFFN